MKSQPWNLSNRAVAREVGCDEKTVRRWLRVCLTTFSPEAGQSGTRFDSAAHTLMGEQNRARLVLFVCENPKSRLAELAAMFRVRWGLDFTLKQIATGLKKAPTYPLGRILLGAIW